MGLIGTWLFCMHHGLPVDIQSPLVVPVAARALAVGDPRAPRHALRRAQLRLRAVRAPHPGPRRSRASTSRRGAVALNGAEPVSPDTLERFAQRFARYGFRRGGDDAGLRPGRELGGARASRRSGAGRASRASRARRSSGTARRAPSDEPRRAALRLGGHARCPSTRCASWTTPARDAGRAAASAGCVFRGPSMTSGYYRQPEATAAITLRRRLARQRRPRLPRWTARSTSPGRSKDLIIKGGRNLVPQEIEEVAADGAGRPPRLRGRVRRGRTRRSAPRAWWSWPRRARATRGSATRIAAAVTERRDRGARHAARRGGAGAAGRGAEDLERQDPARGHARAVSPRARWAGRRARSRWRRARAWSRRRRGPRSARAAAAALRVALRRVPGAWSLRRALRRASGRWPCSLPGPPRGSAAVARFGARLLAAPGRHPPARRGPGPAARRRARSCSPSTTPPTSTCPCCWPRCRADFAVRGQEGGAAPGRWSGRSCARPGTCTVDRFDAQQSVADTARVARRSRAGDVRALLPRGHVHRGRPACGRSGWARSRPRSSAGVPVVPVALARHAARACATACGGRGRAASQSGSASRCAPRARAGAPWSRCATAWPSRSRRTAASRGSTWSPAGPARMSDVTAASSRPTTSSARPRPCRARTCRRRRCAARSRCRRAATRCLKLECWQPTGSFKVRGALATCSRRSRPRSAARGRGGRLRRQPRARASPSPPRRWAARCARRCSCPRRAPRAKVDKLRTFPVEVREEGATYDDAHALALAHAARDRRPLRPRVRRPAHRGRPGHDRAWRSWSSGRTCGTIVVPVGGGGLIAAHARSRVKARAPARAHRGGAAGGLARRCASRSARAGRSSSTPPARRWPTAWRAASARSCSRTATSSTRSSWCTEAEIEDAIVALLARRPGGGRRLGRGGRRRAARGHGAPRRRAGRWPWS